MFKNMNILSNSKFKKKLSLTSQIIFPTSCHSLNGIPHNSGTENRRGFILLLSGCSTPRSQRRGQCRDVPGGAGDAAAEIEGLCYVLDH